MAGVVDTDTHIAQSEGMLVFELVKKPAFF
jgi:hypothetical protein